MSARISIIQFTKNDPLYRIGRSKIQGRGVFATARIRKGTRILEYTGKTVSDKEAARRAGRRKIVLLFDLGDGTFIDGDPRTPGPCVNHSCDPNCFTEQRGRRVFIVAARTIAPGEELTYDYLITPGARHDCFCGAAKCRGTMNGAGRGSRKRRRSSRPGPRRS
jgi:uncharacterized protein